MDIPLLDAEIADNGALRITLRDIEHQKEGTEQLREAKETCSDLDILWEGFEGYWDNGSFEPFSAEDANPFVGLSSAPCIAESMDMDDDGKKTIFGRFWHFENYMLESPIQTLIDKGSVEFDVVFENAPPLTGEILENGTLRLTLQNTATKGEDRERLQRIRDPQKRSGLNVLREGLAHYSKEKPWRFFPFNVKGDHDGSVRIAEFSTENGDDYGRHWFLDEEDQNNLVQSLIEKGSAEIQLEPEYEMDRYQGP